MKTSVVKKLMMCTLAASLVMAPAIGAFATTIIPGQSVVVGAVNGYVNGYVSESESTSGVEDEVITIAEAQVITIAEAVAAIPTTSSVGGVQSVINGAYCATSVDGIAVTTALTSLVQGYGLASNEKPYAMVWDLDPKKSNLARQVIDRVAASQGAEVGPTLNIELGKKSGGKYSLLSSSGPTIRLSVGVPAGFAQDGKTFAVVRVQSGGVVTILQDVDNDPNTVTFDTTGGAGAYAIIKY